MAVPVPKGSHSRSFSPDPDVAERRAKLVEYRRKKIPYKEIYAELGYASPEAASRDFHRALEDSIAAQHASVEVYREEQLRELEYLAEEAHEILRSVHYMVTNSGVVPRHPDNGKPLVDHAPNLAAIDRLVKILDRVAKLRGLDAPQRLEVLTIDAIDAEIQRLHSEIAALGTEAGQAPGVEAPQG